MKLDKRFVDKASGKDLHRPQLELLIGYVREGDTVISAMRWTGDKAREPEKSRKVTPSVQRAMHCLCGNPKVYLKEGVTRVPNSSIDRTSLSCGKSAMSI